MCHSHSWAIEGSSIVCWTFCIWYNDTITVFLIVIPQLYHNFKWFLSRKSVWLVASGMTINASIYLHVHVVCLYIPSGDYRDVKLVFHSFVTYVSVDIDTSKYHNPLFYGAYGQTTNITQWHYWILLWQGKYQTFPTRLLHSSWDKVTIKVAWSSSGLIKPVKMLSVVSNVFLSQVFHQHATSEHHAPLAVNK